MRGCGCTTALAGLVLVSVIAAYPAITLPLLALLVAGLVTLQVHTMRKGNT